MKNIIEEGSHMTTEDIFKVIADGFVLNWINTVTESSNMILRTPIDSERTYKTLAGYYKQMIYSLCSFYHDKRFGDCCEHDISEVIILISEYMEDSKKNCDLFDLMLKGGIDRDDASKEIQSIMWDIDGHVDDYHRKTYPVGK